MDTSRQTAPRAENPDASLDPSDRDDDNVDKLAILPDADGGSDGEDDEEDENAHPAIPTGCWKFMGAMIKRWFQAVHFASAPTSTVADPRFGSFVVHLPWATSRDGDASRQKLLYETELIAYMLYLDPETWWYAQIQHRLWYEGYDPARYDLTELVPKMTFALHHVMQYDVDNQPGAVRKPLSMWLDSNTTSPEYRAYTATKQRILEREDPEGRLRGFKIPTQIQFQTTGPANAAKLRAYLQDATEVVRAFKRKWANKSSTPFRLEAVDLSVGVDYLGDAIAELRELLSLGVPTTIALRHGVTCGPSSDATEWTSYQHGNVYPAIAENPGECNASHSGVYDTLDNEWFTNSYELWSAVAYSSMLRGLRVQFTSDSNPRLCQQLARWMAYSLAHSPGLRSLEIARFLMTHKELDALEKVLKDPVPSSLAPSASETNTPRSTTKLISLKPDTLLECHPRGHELERSDEEAKKGAFHTLEKLHIKSDWQYPVVQTIDAAQRVEFIVPGHGICAASVISVALLCEPPSASHEPQLTKLVISSGVVDAGVTARFVRLVGRKLRELQWDGGGFWTDDEFAFDDDLHEIATVCFELVTLSIRDTTLKSFASLASMHLCELTLVHVAVPMPALGTFFQLLEDKAAPITRTLQRFTYYCRQHPLSIDAVDAVVHMLASNRRLYSVTLLLESANFDVNKKRFKACRDVSVVVDKLPFANKIAVLSVVEHYARQQPAHPLGRLDSGCVASVFGWVGRRAKRRIQVLKCGE